jgi:hypothetical protein
MMDMHFRLLTVISDRNESLAAFHLLKESLRKVGVWAVLEPAPPSIKEGVRHRFWNCFGIENPVERQMLNITVEINPPHEGENRRLAGMFIRDNENRIYLAHTGRVGGGRSGIGLNEFRRYLGDPPWQEILTQGGRQLAVILGPIDAPDFPSQLSNFVHNVARFKKRADKNSATV